ncbi:hypothetical protein PTUN_a3809 [Pseudoalteromonas tunicata]|nr:hypothetical protein PTUN_a3809 [Pseudoalteromonas tunicata]
MLHLFTIIAALDDLYNKWLLLPEILTNKGRIHITALVE